MRHFCGEPHQRNCNFATIFRWLHAASDGMSPAHTPGMKLNHRTLQDLSLQIIRGNPLWGLVVANEYLLPRDPLRVALAKHFTQRLGEAAHSPLSVLLLQGARFRDLPGELASLVGPRETPTNRIIPLNNIRIRPLSRREHLRRPLPDARKATFRATSGALRPGPAALQRSPGAVHTVSLIR